MNKQLIKGRKKQKDQDQTHHKNALQKPPTIDEVLTGRYLHLLSEINNVSQVSIYVNGQVWYVSGENALIVAASLPLQWHSYDQMSKERAMQLLMVCFTLAHQKKQYLENHILTVLYDLLNCANKEEIKSFFVKQREKLLHGYYQKVPQCYTSENDENWTRVWVIWSLIKNLRKKSN